MVDPAQIARLIAENEQYDKCPVCGDEYATVVDNEVACPNEECKHYNKDYAFLSPVEIVTWVPNYFVRELDYGGWFGILEDAITADHVRSVEGPLEDPEEIENVIILWRGSPHVSDQRLLAAVREVL